MYDSNYTHPTIVYCQGRSQNRQMLLRLKHLGYTYNDGKEIDPDNVLYSCWIDDEDGKRIRGACYAIHEDTKIVAYNNYLAMMHHSLHNNPEISFEDFLARIEKEWGEKQ
ncbi:MAG TPA: hypothetical protein GXZ64_06175 [Clostridiaceae bacterium]|nr:hypothetical protein [Clostridiaceae bacterium]